MLDNAGLGIGYWGLDGTCLLMNRKACEEMATPREKLVGRNIRELFGEEAGGMYLDRIQNVATAGRPARYRDEVEMPGGRRVYVATYAPVPDESGKIRGVQIIADDVTEQHRAAQKLRASEALFRNSFEASDVGMAIADNRGQFLSINPAMSRMLGYSVEEMARMSYRQVTHPEDQERSRKRFRQCCDDLMPYTLEKRYIRGDGSVMTGRLTISPIISDGEMIKVVVHLQDITQASQLEEQVRQSQRVEAVGRLAGGVAHDLNNLLSPILGYGDMMLQCAADDGQRAAADEIVRAGGQARDLVRKLLAFSRRQTLEFKPLDIDLAISELEPLLRRTIREDIRVDLEAGERVPPILADPGQVELVLMNLAVNAAEAMPEGGVLTMTTGRTSIEAGDRSAPAPGDYATLIVSDSGCGMEDEVRNRIFEPFFSTKGSDRVGLGLSTVYGIVKQHGGSIRVSTEPRQGSEFVLLFPAAEEPAEPIERDDPTPRNLQGDETILLVEDNSHVRRLANVLLLQRGYRVLVAENGAAALDLLETHTQPVDLLFTDVIMPAMSGKELYEQARNIQPGLRVLYMSGYSDEIIAPRGVLEPGVQFLEKPFSAEALARKLREVLEGDPPAR
ncbi:hypothetical protein ABI59_16570 [Acidobacteria bacterium Mor1]|nr:hypothetical protein ABI59_16570 [Acidobacteria bacterium Mor1]